MLKHSAKQLLEITDKLFSKKQPVLELWQCTAENFYPERADFITSRSLGDEFMEHLVTSYPVLARRDLCNSLSAMLRTDEWFEISVERSDRLDTAGKQWLEWATGTQRRAMYDRQAQFTRATKEGDHDFGTFGQCALSVELSRDRTRFLYRCWHLRDMAWSENSEGKIDVIARNWKPTIRDLQNLFPGKVHPKLERISNKEPFREVECRHIVVPADMYEGEKKWRQPYVSLYIDKENDHVLEEAGIHSTYYIIPRWQTVSGSQYAYSPATVAALPDARLIQAITLTLLDAGEMAARPPMLAKGEAIRSDINIAPAAITVVDAEYDERLGEILRPMVQDHSGLPFGAEIRNDIREMISEAFYLNKLNLPPAADYNGRTAYETAQRVQEYIRQALPLFEPMEMEYNGQICDDTFELGMRNGLFGPIENIPDSLSSQDVRFRFQSPLSEATDRKRGTAFLEAKELLAMAAEMDPDALDMVDAKIALRDALEGIGTPSAWMRTEDALEDISARRAQQQEAAQLMATVGQGAEVAKSAGEAAQTVQAVQQQAEGVQQ